MSNVIPFPNSCKDSNEKKEIIYDPSHQSIEKDDVWIYKKKYRNYPGFGLITAMLLSILDTFSIKSGFAFPSNEYLCFELDCDEKTLRKELNFLKEKGYIWIYFYHTKRGKRREIVTSLSATKYYKLQMRLGYHQKAKQIFEEFISNSFDPDFSEEIKKQTHQVKTELGQPVKTELALETASSNIDYIKSDVNVRPPPPPLKKDLREELTKTFSDLKDIEDGIRWLELQSSNKRKEMNCEIASTIAAVKGGYANEFLIKFDEKAKRYEDKIEKSNQNILVQNQKESKEKAHIVNYISQYLKKYDWFEARISTDGIFFLNPLLPSKKNDEGISFFSYPNGETILGKIPGVYINLKKGDLIFTEELITHFFKLNNLTSTEDKKILEKLVRNVYL